MADPAVVTSMPRAPRDAAALFLSLGCRAVFYRSRTKGPQGIDAKNWTERSDTLATYQDGDNVGVFTGHEVAPGKHLADCDVDCQLTDERRRFLNCLFPEEWNHTLILGRESKPLSHLLLTVGEPLRSFKAEHPWQKVSGSDKLETLLEFRCAEADGSVGGYQTLAAGKHPNGEDIVIARYSGRIVHDPRAKHYVLLGAIGLLLLDTLRTLKHAERLALAGFLLKEGLAEEDVIHLTTSMVRARESNETDLRVALRSTLDHFRAGRLRNIKGWSGLADCIGDEEKARLTLDRIRKWLVHFGIRTEDTETAVTLRLTSAADIKSRPVRWLWKDRLPVGSLSILCGREGIGKTIFAYTQVAALTRGTLDGECAGTARNVIVAATEDSWAHTIRPRLVAAGADLERVFRVEAVTRSGSELPVLLPRDIDALTGAVVERQVALLLLDPLMSRIAGKLDTHKDADVRQALEPLAALADKTEAAVLGIIHVNKGSSKDPLNVVMGSRAFTSVPRAALYVAEDPDNEHGRVVGQSKNNLGRMDLSVLTFVINDCVAELTEDGEEIHTGKLTWTGESERTIHEIVEESSRDGKRQRTAADRACEWLQAHLESRGGAADSKEVKEDAKAAGHSDNALRIAREAIGVEIENSSSKRLSDGKWMRRTWWKLPGVTLDLLNAPEERPEL